MRQARKKKEKDKIAVALMLAFCVIALTSIFTIKSNIEKISGSGQDIIVSENTPADRTQNPAGSPGPEDNKTAAGSDNEEQVSVQIPIVESPVAQEPSAASAFINPVKSADSYITNEYAMDSLIYSVTLDQYMTHCGIDIEAEEDTQVVACAAGTVTAVYEDDRYGICIEISHDDGFITVYGSLSTDEMVETGDTVEAGTIISGVGSTALFESMEPAHLHLEMLKDGVYVNPADYIRF